MKFFILFFLFLSANSQAADLDNACLEKASMAVIDYLTVIEPQSDVHLVKDSKGSVIALTDSEDIFADLELDAIFESSPKESVVYFRDGDYIVFATIQTQEIDGKATCKILDIDSGQDDQD